jgi:hypothetical protein
MRGYSNRAVATAGRDCRARQRALMMSAHSGCPMATAQTGARRGKQDDWECDLVPAMKRAARTLIELSVVQRKRRCARVREAESSCSFRWRGGPGTHRVPRDREPQLGLAARPIATR